jgi:hypothetical protein
MSKELHQVLSDAAERTRKGKNAIEMKNGT